MPRILGVDIPGSKRSVISLTYIFGIGRNNSKVILKKLKIDESIRAKELTEDQLAAIATEIERNYVVEGQLNRQIRQNIQRLKDISCYRGFRHRKGLPVRGQRTRSNARSRKGPRRTVAGKKKVVGKKG